MPLNHSVRGSSPRRLTLQTTGYRAGVIQIKPIKTLVAWAFAPEWLTVEEASSLSGHDPDTLHWLIEDGALDTRRQGETWLIEKTSLWEFQQCLLEVLQIRRDGSLA